jgi:hypothetical protein
VYWPQALIAIHAGGRMDEFLLYEGMPIDRDILEKFEKEIKYTEFICLLWYARGLTDIEIAQKTNYALSSIHTYRRDGRSKLGLDNLPTVRRDSMLMRDVYFVMLYVEKNKDKYYPYMQARDAVVPTIRLFTSYARLMYWLERGLLFISLPTVLIAFFVSNPYQNPASPSLLLSFVPFILYLLIYFFRKHHSP